MAAAAAEATLPDRASDDETLLHCSVCQENFHPKSRLPRSLPCHHSFCGDCIDKLEQDSQVKCPMCRKVAKVEGPFPVDDTHITYLELRLPAQAEEAPSCEDCPDKEKAAFHCQDCSTNLCDACSKAHKRVKIARNHTIIELTEIAKNPELLKLAPEKCDIHKDRPFEFFCKACDKPVCAACTAILHRDGHDIADLEDTMKTWRHKVISEHEEFSETIEGLEAKAASLKTILDHMDTDHNNVIEDIEKTFVELQTALNVRKATLLADLGAKVKANRLALEEELATVESHISSSKATRDYSQRLVQYGHPTQFVAHLKDTTNQVLLREAQQTKKAFSGAVSTGQFILKTPFIYKVLFQFGRRNLQLMETSIEAFGLTDGIYAGTITQTVECGHLVPGRCVSSDVTRLCDGAWCVEAKYDVESGHLCLFLRCTVKHKKSVQFPVKHSTQEYFCIQFIQNIYLSWSFMVNFEMKILNFVQEDQATWKDGSVLFANGASNWGWTDFITMSNVTDPEKGFVRDGKIHIKCTFRVDLSKRKPTDSEESVLKK